MLAHSVKRDHSRDGKTLWCVRQNRNKSSQPFCELLVDRVSTRIPLCSFYLIFNWYDGAHDQLRFHVPDSSGSDDLVLMPKCIVSSNELKPSDPATLSIWNISQTICSEKFILNAIYSRTEQSMNVESIYYLSNGLFSCRLSWNRNTLNETIKRKRMSRAQAPNHLSKVQTFCIRN